LGATSDIAIAAAHCFAKAGHPIMLAGRNVSSLLSIEKNIEEKFSVGCSSHEFDTLDIKNHKLFYASLPTKPHVIICAVGLLGSQTEDQQNLEDAQLVMQSNYIGPSLALEAAVETLLTIKEPTAIIGISSVAGDRGRAKNYIYGSAKAGFSAYLSGMRQRLSKTPINIITFKPGFVKTKMTHNIPLPDILTSSAQQAGERIYSAFKGNKSNVYTKHWRLLMFIISCLPEWLFKKLRF
jgi:hypothetical protein